MGTKEDIIQSIQQAADAYYEDTAVEESARKAIKIVMGSTDSSVPIFVAGEPYSSGAAWREEPKPFPTLIEGISNYLDGENVSSIAAITEKVNELITQYNQLLDDYDNGVVPSAAQYVVGL